MQNNTFSGLFVGQNLIRLNEVGSTNTFLKDALSKSTPLIEGTVILADKQSAGRGQIRNIWHSEEGKNLTFSILLNPGFLSIDRQFDLNKAVSLALVDALTKYAGPVVSVKWPNDIYIHGKKACGILIENMIQGSKIKHSVIGIGLNVNQISFPSSLENVTSLKLLLQKDYELSAVLGDICNAVEVRYLQLKTNRSDILTADYLKYMHLLNIRSIFKIEGKVVMGIIRGLTNTGMLIFETGSEVRHLGNKEIEFIHNETVKP